jgi:aldose 1-epimerase
MGFPAPRALPETLVDNGFCEWDGHCLIQQPDLGHELECQASGSDYYLLYCPVRLIFSASNRSATRSTPITCPVGRGCVYSNRQSTSLGFTLHYRAL